jgi:transcriptional regulator with XRE-family HTH domain
MTNTDLRRLRHQLKLTQVDLAAVLGVTPTSLARWEQGRYQVPQLAAVAVTLLAERATANRSTSAPQPPSARRRRHDADEPLDVGAADAFPDRPSKGLS